MVLVCKERCFKDFKESEVVSRIKREVKILRRKICLGLVFNSKNYMVDLRSRSYVVQVRVLLSYNRKYLSHRNIMGKPLIILP